MEKKKYQVSIGFNDTHETWEVELNSKQLDVMYENMVNLGLKIECFSWSIHSLDNSSYDKVKEGMLFTIQVVGDPQSVKIIKIVSKFNDGLQYSDGGKFYYMLKENFINAMAKGRIKHYV